MAATVVGKRLRIVAGPAGPHASRCVSCVRRVRGLTLNTLSASQCMLAFCSAVACITQSCELRGLYL